MPHNCLLTVADGHWRPLLPREDPSKMHLLMVEYSKSGRAKCRKCGESIPKGELRVGAPIKWRGGTHGWISSWQHLRCVRLEDPSSCDVDKHIYGLDSLTKSEQEEVRKEVLKTEVPEHLKPVDPEDPKFMAKKELKPAKQPKELKIEMLPYQKEGLGWMIEQESSPIKGGILADEMGMGKTLQMISLIVAQKPRGKLERKSNSGPTLIVCPTSAMMQWEEEIRSRTTENALSVFVFYAKRHLVDVDFLMQFDVVLTTYSVLEYEFRRILDQHKVACKYCGRKFLPRTLKSHNYYFCGPNAKRTAKQAKTEKRNPRKMTKKALKKAMKTLRIGTNVPTPSNIYREIMSQANRDPIPWFEKAPRSQEPREGKDGTEEENEEEEKENNDDRVDDDNEENDDDDDDDQEATGMKKSAPLTKRRGRSKGKNAKKRKIPSEDDDEEEEEEEEEEEKENVVKKPPPKKRRGRSATKGSLKDADEEVNEKKTGRANKRRGRPKKKIEEAGDSDGEEQGGNEVGGKSTKRVKKGRTSSSRKSQKSKKETKVTKKRRGSNKSTPRKKAAQSKSSQDDSFDAEDFVEDNKGMDEKTRRDAELAMSLQLMACEDDEEDYSPTAQAEILKSIEKRRRSRNKKASTTPRSAKRVKRTKSSAPSGKKRSNASSSSSSSSSKASPSVTRRSARTTNSSRKKTPKTSVPTSDEDADEVAKGPLENTPTRRTKQASCDLKEGTLTDIPPLEEIFGSSSDDDQEQAGRQGKRNDGAGGSPAAADGIVKKEQRGGGAEKGEREEESPKPRKRAARRLRSLGGGLKKGQKKKQKQKELDEAENKEEEEPLSLPMPCPPSLLLRRSPRTSRGVVSYVDDSSENEDEAAGKAEKGERRDVDDEDKDPDFVVNEEEEEDEDDDEEEGADGQDDDDDDDDGDDYEQEEEENYTPPNTGKKAKRGSKAANSGTRKQSKETRKKRTIKKKKKRKNGKDVDDNEDDDDSDSGEDSAGAGRGRRGKTKRRFKKNVKEGDIGWCHDEGISLGGSALHLVLWGRIILDEAHKIKARTNNTAKSVYALHSKTKWCVTGTPLQNRVGELYSLVRFLKMDKFSQYFCAKKGCECVSERWNFGRMQRSCTTCNHPPMSHYSYFNKMVINPIKRYGYTGDGRKALMTLKNEVLDRIMLRRTKQERAKDVKLPPLKVKVEKLSLDERERDFYDCIYRQSRSKFDTYVDKGTLLHNYAHIFDLLSRLRQAVDHPYLVIHGARAAPASGGSENSSSKSDGRGNKPAAIPTRSRGLADVCGICREDIKPKDVVGSACRHTFHRKCVHEYTQRKLKEDAGYLSCPVCYDAFTITIDFRKLKMRSGHDGKGDVEERACILCLERPMDALLMDCGHMYTCMECAKKIKGGAGGKKACPICRAPIKKIIRSAGGGKQIAIGRQNLMNRVKVEEFASSSKVDALMRHIREIREASNQHKAIIFSQYTGMLDIVEWRLNKLGLKTVKLSGSLSVKQRVSVLAAFRGDSSVAAILMSLKAGGEGLNLQEASHVFLLDPWWNPAVEMQAIQRAHRIGQTREVQAVRFITEDTIEDRMLELQQKKELVFSGTIDAKASSLTQLTEEDLRFLFQS